MCYDLSFTRDTPDHRLFMLFFFHILGSLRRLALALGSASATAEGAKQLH